MIINHIFMTVTGALRELEMWWEGEFLKISFSTTENCPESRGKSVNRNLSLHPESESPVNGK